MADKIVTVTIKAIDTFSFVISQYNQKIGQAASASRQASDANKDAVSSFDGLKTTVGGAVAAFGAQQMIGFVEKEKGVNEKNVKAKLQRRKVKTKN